MEFALCRWHLQQKQILSQVRKLQPDDQEFIFYRGDSLWQPVTFNRHLKKCCDELGIEYRSSHKLRFSTASIMYKNGMEDTELQKLLGHTTLSMTRHYLCNTLPTKRLQIKWPLSLVKGIATILLTYWESYEWLFAQTTTLQNIFLREITEAKDLIDPQIFYMYAWISNIHCHW